MSRLILPSFVIIGAVKSATTWLVNCLNRHPQIYIPLKEIHFFSRFFSKRLTWYHKHFKRAKPSQFAGENSNTYLESKEATMRIKKMIPEVKLIVCLRNPVERAYSDYCMNFEKARVSADIAIYLNPYNNNLTNDSPFLYRGLYAKHIKRYFKYFEKSQIKILLYDDLVLNSQKFIEDVYEFLGVKELKLQSNVDTPVNIRRYKTYPKWFKSILSTFETISLKIPFTYSFLRNLSSRSLIMKIKELMAFRSIEYPLLSDELKGKLIGYYKSDINELEGLINRDLNKWYR